MCLTCANEKHIIRVVQSLYSVHGELRVAHVSFKQQWLAANHAIHEEMILHEVQHLIWHVQGGGDGLGPSSVGDALQEQRWKNTDTLKHTAEHLFPSVSLSDHQMTIRPCNVKAENESSGEM